MADAPASTYRVDHVDDVDRYVCIIPYQGKEDNICGHWTTDRELFIQHTFIAHNGQFIAEVTPTAAPQAHGAVKAKAGVASVEEATEKR